jgi:hypothetical protein
MMTEQAVRKFAPDPPAKAMHDRAHESRALIGREDRDGATDQAHNNKGSHEFAPSIRGAGMNSPARAHKVRSSSTE